MEPNEKELLQKAQENPHYMFNEEEIAVLCNVTLVIVARVASAPDSPFFLNKCRPEWFVQWIRRHADFSAANVPSTKDVPQSQGSSSANPWADARRAVGGQRER
jgi:hypothetical protein